MAEGYLPSYPGQVMPRAVRLLRLPGGGLSCLKKRWPSCHSSLSILKKAYHNSPTNFSDYSQNWTYFQVVFCCLALSCLRRYVRKDWSRVVCYCKWIWTEESLHGYETSATVITYVSEARMYKDSLALWRKNWVTGEERRWESSFHPTLPPGLLLTCTHCLSQEGRRLTFGIVLIW